MLLVHGACNTAPQPHDTACMLFCWLQSEVAVHCFPGALNEGRAHASSGNMRPPTFVSADGAHNSCPQVLHSQVG